MDVRNVHLNKMGVCNKIRQDGLASKGTFQKLVQHGLYRIVVRLVE